MSKKQSVILFVVMVSTGCGVLSQSSQSFARLPGDFSYAQQPAGVTEQRQAGVDTYIERARRSGRVLELALDDAIKMALVNNLEIAVEDLNQEINEKRHGEIQGFYDPIVTLEAGYADATVPTGSVIQAGAEIVTFQREQGFWNGRFTQNLPWGGSYSVDWLSSRSGSNSTLLTVNPQFNSSFTLSLTQPLLRGFARTQARRQLSLINLDVRLSERQFEQKVADVVRQVHDQYWELVFAIRNQNIKRQSVELARRQHEDNKRRVEIGTLAPIEITAARAEVAAREQEMIASEEGIIGAENNFKRLLTEDPASDVWNLMLIPAEEPVFSEYKVNLDEAIKAAVENRPEIAQMRIQLERVAVDEAFLSQEGKWKVDLVTSYVSTGLAGVPLRRGVPDPTSPLFGSLGPLYRQVFGQDFRTYSSTVRVEIPLGNRQNEMQLAQLGLQGKQILSRIKNIEQQVVVEVRNAAEAIETTRKRVETARVARELSLEQLDGEMKRFEAGLSTNFLVLQYQRDLGEAQLRELRSLIDYRKAITALQKATDTILSANDIQTARQGSARRDGSPPSPTR